MSLIQEALKKAQKEREVGSVSNKREINVSEQKLSDTGKKRGFRTPLLFISGLMAGAIIIGSLLLLQLFTGEKREVLRNPVKNSVNLNIHSKEKNKMQGAESVRKVAEIPVKTETEQPESKEVRQKRENKREKIEKSESERIVVKKITSDDKKRKTDDFSSLAEKGEASFKNRDYIEAAGYFRESLKFGKKPEIYYRLYYIFRRTGNSLLAKEYALKGLKFYPDNFLLLKVAALIKIRERFFDEALGYIEKALAADKSDYSLHTYRGLCIFHMKKYDKALISFFQSLKLNKTAYENLYYIGLIYDNLKQYERAVFYYRKFINQQKSIRKFKHYKWIKSRLRILEKN